MKDTFRWRNLLLMPALAALVFTSGRAGADACAAADADALTWLDKMSRSLQRVSYHGIVTFQRGDEMQAMQVSHFIEDGVANERLTELTGHGAEVVRVDHPLECVHPGNQLLQLGATLQAGECGVAQYYRFGVFDGELVAGRRAVQIRIEPRDMYRYGYILELDRDTGLLLKSATIGRGNKILENFQFASLSFTGEVSPGDDGHVVHKAEHSQPGEGALSLGGVHTAWTVKWLPQGFTATDQPADVSMRRTFTDGLAVFSIFLELLSQDITPGEGVVRNGGTISYTRGMHMSGMPVLVTVIGEVPVNTARMVADSVTAVP